MHGGGNVREMSPLESEVRHSSLPAYSMLRLCVRRAARQLLYAGERCGVGRRLRWRCARNQDPPSMINAPMPNSTTMSARTTKTIT